MKLRKSTLLKNKELKLFKKGILFFNKKEFYNAHEKWEELWTEYKLKDPKFIQGLIQLSVAFFHITNSNLIGSKNLFKKSLIKLELFSEFHENINLSEIIFYSKKSLRLVNEIDSVNKFNWELAPKIIFKP